MTVRDGLVKMQTVIFREQNRPLEMKYLAENRGLSSLPAKGSRYNQLWKING
jgi:hypothetical protein